MKKVLMILTSHRLDCFYLTMDFLKAAGSLQQFDRVVLLLNGVEGPHLDYVRSLMAALPQVPWDTIAGPRGKKERVANLQNECVRRYPDSLYFKIDEDVFVSKGWVEKLTAAYEQFQSDDNLALITPLIPNNALGCHYLLTHSSALAEEYHRRFSYPVTSDYNGPIWNHPDLAQWLMRKFMHLEKSNGELGSGIGKLYHKFAYRFSINCLVYDYRHWSQLGGIPNDEEPAWGQWVPDHGKFNVLVTNTMVQHYSFFTQQDWMDRSHLLEDFRRINLPDTLPSRLAPEYWRPWLARVIEQFPRAVKRKAIHIAHSIRKPAGA